MYIARKPVNGGYEYSLKKSYYDPPYWKSKLILNLGTDPAKYITYYSEVAFSIDLEEELANLGYSTDQQELENLFFRFLNPETQRIISQFTKPKSIKRSEKPVSLDLFHPFDVKRYIVLKLGVLEPEKFLSYPFPFLKNIIKKSRDELENFFWDMEDELNHREKMKYVRAIFGVLKLPYQMREEEVDDLFLKNLCQVLEDEDFRMGLTKEEVLCTYFCRYIWLYFDNKPRFYQRENLYKTFYERIYVEAAYYLGVSIDEIKRANKKEILILFRKMAKVLHPDQGGSKEGFIKLKKVVEELLKLKKD
ncbi:hypothetical protein F1847_00360 [Thermodesulfobacterium sp. TA1]|uniref:hypothetical protein n=1 Tax=Thermodesulfobacterium sp. TA1 TaxID=2234087 RepID=UPI001231A619|nr:hypothetical protein [Thermodesulfobacterium sp. TA1]QER41263.1 hypothetical protein F1847_00360 [Thermodesulfobacterium sp. TA1]